MDAQVEYWQNQLPGFSPWTSPLHVGELSFHRRVDRLTYRAGTAGVVLDSTLYARMQELCAREGVTVYMLVSPR